MCLQVLGQYASNENGAESMTLKQLVLTLALLLPGLSQAQETGDRVAAIAMVNQWYVVHLAGHGNNVLVDSVSNVLADDARIDLPDLGIVQTKAEYVEALDNWPDAIEGGTIAHVVTAADGVSATAKVCYRFVDNELLSEETFAFTGGQVSALTSKTLAETCAGF